MNICERTLQGRCKLQRLGRALLLQFPREDWVERSVCAVTIFVLFLADSCDMLKLNTTKCTICFVELCNSTNPCIKR